LLNPADADGWLAAAEPYPNATRVGPVPKQQPNMFMRKGKQKWSEVIEYKTQIEN
jgi:hypothetical protein